MAYFQYQHLHYIIRRKNVLLTNKDLLLFHIFVYRYALTLETSQFAKLQHIHMPINVFLLTLSGFPFHINLKHLLSISFLNFEVEDMN
jgi:hypothetical protein